MMTCIFLKNIVGATNQLGGNTYKSNLRSMMIKALGSYVCMSVDVF